jgi:ABC-type thiamine transport system substrate-binding protein
MYYVVPASTKNSDLAVQFIELATSPEVQAEGIVERFNWYPGIDAKYLKDHMAEAVWNKLFAEITPEDLAANGKTFPLVDYFNAILTGYEADVE